MKNVRKLLWCKKILFLIFLVLVWILWQIPAPSHERPWQVSQAITPSAKIEGDLLRIKNIRDFYYRTPDDFDVRYHDESFDLNQLKKVWLGISNFSDSVGIAHAFLSFEFSNGQTLAISIEARLEKDEKYSLFGGILKKFELIYVVGTERDLIRLRTDFRGEKVYFYPIKTTPKKARALLEVYVKKIQTLEKHPEFYHTLLHNCANQILSHVKDFSYRDFPWTIASILPGYADGYLYGLGLIENPENLSREALKEKYRIKNLPTHYENFSEFIRINH
jgi:hypothetical protein